LNGNAQGFRSSGHESVIRTGSVVRELNELWGYNIGKPDVIGGHKEDEPFLDHFIGSYFQQDWRFSSSPDG
jgi:hypothetical protein